MELIARKIHNHIQQARKVVVIPHQNPDGDALGAATAFHEYLVNLGKDVTIFCATPVHQKLHFIPHSSKVVHDPTIFTERAIDTIVLLDSGDLRYAGVYDLVRDHQATIINIDHHATNEHYGKINLVIPAAAATCEVLFHYFRHNNISINPKMATSLLTGLATDTSNFSNSATSAIALAVGSELIRSGGNYNLINDATIKNKSVEVLRLWGKVLSRLTKDEKTSITYTFITKADLEQHQVSEAESEGIANFLNNLENTSIAMILRETADGKIKGSFRTTRSDIDVSALAKKLGGGGHKKAAGFSADGTIEEVVAKILTLR